MSDDSKTSIFRKESLERLSSPEQLDQLMQIVTPSSWIPLASLGTLVLLAIAWSIFGRIPITTTGEGILVYPTASSNQLINLTYFDTGSSALIQPGMRIIIVPAIANSEQAGGIWGRVKSVSTPTITTLNAVQQAESSDPNALSDQAIEVIAELESDPSTTSGYKWTSLGGSQLNLTPGTATTVRITLQEKAPIAFVFPFLDNR